MHGRTFNTGAIDRDRDRSDTSNINNKQEHKENDRKGKKTERSNGQKARIKRRMSNGFKIRAVLSNRMYHGWYLHRLSSHLTFTFFSFQHRSAMQGVVCFVSAWSWPVEWAWWTNHVTLFLSFSFSLSLSHSLFLTLSLFFFSFYWLQIGTCAGALFLLAIFYFNPTVHQHRSFSPSCSLIHFCNVVPWHDRTGRSICVIIKWVNTLRKISHIFSTELSEMNCDKKKIGIRYII